MKGTSVWRKDLKPVGEEELRRAFEIKWGKEFRVNPRNYDRISTLMSQYINVTLVANAGVSLCEIQVYDGEPIPRLEWVIPKHVQKNIVSNKERIPVVFIKSLLEKGMSDKEIRSFFKETRQIISLSQIRAIQENRTKRKYISAKKNKIVDKKEDKEKSGRKRRIVEKVGATSTSNSAPNESKTKRVRRSSPRITNSDLKSSKKVRSK